MQLISRENTIDDLIRFVKFYAGEPKDEYKIPKEQIPEYLPRPLKLIYHEFGNFPSHNPDELSEQTLPLNNDGTNHLFHNQDALVYFDQLKEENGRVEFAWENSGNWSAVTETYKDDPPVYSDAHLVWDVDNKQKWIWVCHQLSHFLATLCLQELVYGSKNFHSFKNDYDQNQFNQVLEKSRAIWLDGKYVYENQLFSYYLTEDENLLMLISNRPDSISNNKDDDTVSESLFWRSLVR